jgi:hypothetical protein
MLLLAATTDKLQITTSAAGTLDVHASFLDISNADPPVVKGSTAGRQNTAITTAATTDVLAAPAASTVRNLKSLHVRNKSATTATDVTVLYNANGTTYELFKCNLDTGEMLEYVEGVGFFEVAAAAKVDTIRRVTADYTNSTVTPSAITGMTFDVLSGKFYHLEAWMIRLTALTTTGAQFFISGVAMTSMQVAEQGANLASTSAATMVAGAVTAVDTAIVAEGTGPTAAAPVHISGMINPSASGQLTIKGASEVAASLITVKAGSWARLREFDN